MKKILIVLILGLVTLGFSGCEDTKKINQEKIEFQNNAFIDFNKARLDAEAKFGNKTVQEWIDNDPKLKQLEHEYKEWDKKQRKQKDWSKFQW